MKQTSLAKWLKFIIFGIGICGLIVYALVLPAFGQSFADSYHGEFDNCYWPWLIFLWATGIPCFIALIFAWKIAGNIGADKSFSSANAKLLKWISLLAAGDAAFFFMGNIVYLLLDMNHPGIVLFSLIIEFIGIAIAVASAALSHLVQKATTLQEQSDWTI